MEIQNRKKLGYLEEEYAALFQQKIETIKAMETLEQQKKSLEKKTISCPS